MIVTRRHICMHASITCPDDSIVRTTYAVMIVLHFDRPVMIGVVIIGEGVRERAWATVGGRMRVIHLGRLLVGEKDVSMAGSSAKSQRHSPKRGGWRSSWIPRGCWASGGGRRGHAG